MNLCSPTNSLQSNILHAAVEGAPAPYEGMGVTILYWTDRHVGTVVKVHSPDHVEFTEDATLADKSKELGMGHQEWVHTPQPDGPRMHAVKHSNGRWYVAHPNKRGKMTVSLKSLPVALGRKDYHIDWSF